MRKNNIRNMLSAEERAEYDALVFEAGFYEDGTRRPSHEIADRFHDLLLDAVQAKRPWAQWVLDEDARAGHLRRFKGWDRIRHPVQTRKGGRVIRLSGVQALRRRDPETEALFWQDTELGDMDSDDLDSVIEGMRGKIEPLTYNLETAKSLRELLDGQPKGTRVKTVLAGRGLTINQYLLGEGEAA